MSGTALALHQFRYDQKVFWRNPAAVFFTVMFPVILLLIFATVFGGQTVDVRGGVKTTTYYVPAIITLSVISATMLNLAMSLTIAREDGRLKRGRGTPMPAWVFIAGRIGNAIVVSLLMLVLLASIGGILYGVQFPWGRLPAIVLTPDRRRCLVLLPGSCPDRAHPVARTPPPRSPTRSSFPLYFLSGVFIPEIRSPAASSTSPTPSRSAISSRPSSAPSFRQAPAAPDFEWGNLAVVAAWGIAGLLFAVRYFRWTPRAG